MLMLRPLAPEQIRAMGHVRRWHTRRVDQPQNLLEHSAGVALLALHLAGDRLGALEELDLLKLALTHDAHETRFGDLPYPAKIELLREGHDLDGHCRRTFWNGLDPYGEVSQEVLDLLEVADVLEAALWSRDNAPEICAAVAQQAIEAARVHLDNIGVARVLEALGMRVEVER